MIFISFANKADASVSPSYPKYFLLSQVKLMALSLLILPKFLSLADVIFFFLLLNQFEGDTP